MTHIGLFDSGVGGLTILDALVKAFPFANFTYYGDTKNAPYGDKSVDMLREINQDIIQQLVDCGIDTMVFACNTSIALFFDQVSETLDIPCYDLVSPTAAYLAKNSALKKVGVLATTRTCETGIYAKKIQAKSPHIEVIERPCPDLVPIIESGQIHAPEALPQLLAPLEALSKQGIDTIVHGCSHYPFLESIWQQHFPDMHFVNPARALADSLSFSQETMAIPGEIRFIVSGEKTEFDRLVNQLQLTKRAASKATLL